MNTLVKVLRETLLPSIEKGTYHLITEGNCTHRNLPSEIQVTRRKLRGKRTVGRERRDIQNLPTTLARWPEDGLQETRYPKMACVLDGQLQLQIREQLIECGAGCFLLIPAGTPHSNGKPRPVRAAQQAPNYSCDILWIVPVGARVLCWLASVRGATHQSRAEQHWLLLNEQASRLFNLLMDEAESGREECETICGHLLTSLLITMQREVRAGRYLHPGPMALDEAIGGRAGADPIAQAQEYMRAHLHQPLTLEKVARQVGLSRTQLATRLRQKTGHTFLEFLTTRRIEEAKLLLRDSDWSVATIAELVGIKSPTYFQDLFKRHADSTPGQFRRRIREVK